MVEAGHISSRDQQRGTHPPRHSRLCRRCGIPQLQCARHARSLHVILCAQPEPQTCTQTRAYTHSHSCMHTPGETSRKVHDRPARRWLAMRKVVPVSSDLPMTSLHTRVHVHVMRYLFHSKSTHAYTSSFLRHRRISSPMQASRDRARRPPCSPLWFCNPSSSSPPSPCYGFHHSLTA